MNLLRQLIPIAAFAGWLTCAAFAATPGNLDTTFDTGAGVEAATYSDVAIGSDGKAVVIGGNGVSGKILRINADGSLDRTFAVNAGFGLLVDEAPVCVIVQADLKIVVAGHFRFFEGAYRQGILRLNADGTLDTAFDPSALLQRVDDFAPIYIRQLALQPDGKIIAAGGFRYTGGDGVSRVNLVRFNANGTIDATFKPETDPSFAVDALAIGPAGQIALSYARTTGEGERVYETVRLLSSGARDTTFDDGAGATQFMIQPGASDGVDYPVGASALAVQADGSVLIGGIFDKFNGVARAGLTRLTSSGAVDPNFVPASFRYVVTYSGETQPRNLTGTIRTLKVTDGKVLVSGNFTHMGSPDGPARRGLARLDGNGVLDESFAVGTGFGPNYPEVTGVAVRPLSGEIVVTGSFSLLNDQKVPGVVQLTRSGAIDAPFLAKMAQGFDKPPQVLAVQDDGKLLVGGEFNRAAGILQPGLVRLNPDSSVDTSFNTGGPFLGAYADGSQFSAPITHIAIQSDGKIVVAGGFTTFQGSTRHRILRLNSDGSLDPSFDPGEGFYYEYVRGSILGLALWRDPANPSDPERIVVLGGFTGHVQVGMDENGDPTSTVRSRAGIARLNADGTLDTSFDPGTGFTNPVLRNAVMTELLVQPDGKIIAAGSFSAYNDVPVATLVRLNGDGTHDTSFDTSVSFANEGSINALARRDDGKLLVGGRFAPSAPNSYFNTVLRLNDNGSRDAGFDAGTGFRDVYAGELHDLVLQADGKIVAAGLFLKCLEVNRRSIARLNADGTLDTSFDPGAGVGGSGLVYDIALQADGKIIATGSFNRYDGTVRHYLARIHGGAGGGDPDPEESDLRLTGTATSAVDPTGATTRPGELITYTLTYANVSGEAVTDAVVTATIPPGTSFKPAKPKDGSRLMTRKVNGISVKQVEWKIGALAAGAGGTVSFQALVSKKAEIESTIRFLDSEITAKRNGAPLAPSRGTPVRSLVMSLLDVTSTTVTSEAGPGGLIIYKFAVRNDGSAPMTDVQLRYVTQFGSGVVSAFFTDASGVEIGSPAKAQGGVFNPSVDEIGSAVTWFFNKIPAQSTGYAKLTVRLWYDRTPDQPLQGGELFGSYRISNKPGTAPRVIPATVAATGQLAAERPYLGLSKTVEELSLVTDPTMGEVAATNVGDKFTFSLWAYNIGERSAERVFIQERAPENTVIDPASVRINDAAPTNKVAVTDKGRTMRVPIGDLGTGAVVKVSYRVRVLPRQDKAINYFLVSEGGYIGSATLGETVHAHPEPLLVKVVERATFSPSTEEKPARAEIGQVVQHFIRFQNNNGQRAKNARITNPIPAGAKFRGAGYVEKVNGSYVDAGSTRNGVPIAQPALNATSGDIVFHLGNLDAGEAVTVRVDLEKTADVLMLNPPQLRNVARMDFGPDRNAKRERAAAEVDPDLFALAPGVEAIGLTPVLDPSVPRFFLSMMAPAAVKAGEQITYLGSFGNTGEVGGTATIRLNVPPDTVAHNTIDLGPDADPSIRTARDPDGSILITAYVQPHSRQAFSIIGRALDRVGEVIVSSGHRISGDGFSFVTAGRPLATYIYSREAGFDVTSARSAVEAALLDAAGINFAYGRDNSAFKEELRLLNARTISTILVGADAIPLKNGSFIVSLGGDQVLVGAAGIVSNDGAIVSNDGATIVSNDGATIVSNDGATIISGGAGNIRFHGLPGFAGSPTAAALLADPNRIISGGAGNLLNLGGHNLFGGINGTALVNNASGGFANADYFRATSANIISGGAGNVIGQDGAGIISGGAGNIHVMGAGNIISGGGGNILGDQGSGIISNDGATLTTSAGGNIISGGGGNIISGGAGN